MEWGRFSLIERDGTEGEYPLRTATVTIYEANGEWWLSVQAQTTPPDWVCPPEGNIPEFPAIDASSRIAGPDSAAWLGREFALPEERDPQTGYYPAWLYTTGGYDALSACVVSVGERIRDRIAVRVVAQGSVSGCSIRVVGEFALLIGNVAEAGKA